MKEQQQIEDEQYDKKYVKIVLVGESGVGKSNIISRYVENKFSVGTNTTIGLEFSEKHVSVNGENMILQIWDTAGQERFRALNKTFYKNSLGALVIFDLSDRNSFEQLGRWISQLRQNLEETAVFLLVGNKCDVKDQKVSVTQAIELAKKQGMGYLQSSAALGTNVRESFQLLTRKILERVKVIKEFQMNTIKKKPMAIKPKNLNQIGVDNKKKDKCCK